MLFRIENGRYFWLWGLSIRIREEGWDHPRSASNVWFGNSAETGHTCAHRLVERLYLSNLLRLLRHHVQGWLSPRRLKILCVARHGQLTGIGPNRLKIGLKWVVQVSSHWIGVPRKPRGSRLTIFASIGADRRHLFVHAWTIHSKVLISVWITWIHLILKILLKL